MSVTLEIRGKDSIARWPMTSSCISGLSRLKSLGFEASLKMSGLTPDTELGIENVVKRADLLNAIAQLLEKAKEIPNGFQVRIKGLGGNIDGHTGKGVSGLLIEGIMYMIFCSYDSWKILPMAISPIPAGQPIPADRLGEPRQDAADIPTENYGIVKVESKKGRSDIAILLRNIKRFIASAPDESFIIVIG